MAATKEHVDNHHLLLPEKKEKHISQNLRVLAIDDNVVCLKVLAFKLKKCGYQVTATTKAEEAIEMLKKNKYQYDIVITDVIRSDMDGFRILEIVGLELDIPVIMISANGDLKTVEKGVKHGARDYLVKPVPIEILKNIWQHVLRKTISCTAPKSDAMEAKSLRNNSLPYNNNNKKRNRGRDHEDHNYESGQSSEESLLAQKKLRTAWTPRLHEKFLAAVQQLGVEKAVPKKILEIMNESQLTRESVASHLQKYRNLLKKQKEISMNEARQSLMGTNGIPHFSNHINHGGLHSIDQMNSYIDTGMGSFTGRNLPFLPLNYRDTASQQNRVPSESVNLMWKNMGIPELYSMKYHNDQRQISTQLSGIIDAGGPKNSGSFTDELFVGNSNHNLQVFNRPYSYSPPAFNLDHVHAPHQMFSQPHSPIGQVSNSLPVMAAQGDRGMQDKRSLVSYCGNGDSNFREESISASPVDHHMQGQIDGSLGNYQVGYTQQSLLDCSERSEISNDLHLIEGSADDDLSVMVKQFACDAAPRI